MTLRLHSDRRRPRIACGFSQVELLSIVALAGVVMTLIASMVANARIRGQRTVCMENLRQVCRAVHSYTEENGKRPRSFTRVMASLPGAVVPASFLCPSDPVLRGSAGKERVTNAFWGNYANASQEPWSQTDLREPESGSWSAELAEVKETEPFSYLHPLGWRRLAWQRLATQGTDFGTAICQLHGVKVPPVPGILGFKPYLQYEGEVLRGTDDGSVVKRKVFRPGAASDAPAGTDYPWEFYMDAPPVSSR